MSSRERLLTSLNIETPDRVPIAPLMYAQLPSNALGIPPRDLAPPPVAKYLVWKADLQTFRMFKMDAQVGGAYDVIHTE